MKLHNILIFAVTASLSISCSSHEVMPAPYIPAGLGASSHSARVKTHSAKMAVEVDDTNQRAKEVESMVRKSSGILVSVDLNDKSSGLVNMKVPEEKLELMLDEIGTLGKVTSRRVKSKDITEQVADAAVKLENLRQLRSRYRKLLDRAEKVDEMLKIERELARVQTEIEQLEARNRSLSQQVAMADVELKLSQKIVPGPVTLAGKGAYWTLSKLFVLN